MIRVQEFLGGRNWLTGRNAWLGSYLFLLLCHVGLLVHGNWIHFPNTDEIGHLPSGVSKWHFGTFHYYSVNPPMVDLVSGLGALHLRNEYEWDALPGPLGHRIEFIVGRTRMIEKGLDLHRDFFLPRLLVLPFSLLGCVLLTWLAYRELGPLSAWIACCLWSFCPNILAHAQTIIPDVGSVAIGILPSLAVLTYMRTPNWGMASVVGFALGLAMYSKMTWVTGVISFPLAAAIGTWLVPANRGYFTLPRIVGDWLLMGGVALFVLNNGYLLQGTGTLLGEYRFLSHALGGPEAGVSNPSNRFVGTPLAWLPVPLPYDYVMGIDYLKHEVEMKYWSFLMGEWRLGGWWYYYLCTTLFKTPLGTLLALVPATYLLVRRWSPASQQAWIALAVPACVIFVSVSSQTGFNHHHRYVLTIYPPIFFLIAGAFQAGVASVWLRRTLLFLCGAAVVASLSVWPHFLTFFNRVAGGPERGWQVLDFSNVDWGQDLLLVEKWIQNNPDKRPCWATSDFSSFRSLGGRSIDVEPDPIPKPSGSSIANRLKEVAQGVASADPAGSAPKLSPGWYIVNVRLLNDLPDELRLGYFRSLQPVDRIAYSYWVYYVP